MMKRKNKKAGPVPVREISIAELNAILDRAKSGSLTEEDHVALAAAVATLACLTREIQAKNASILRMRKILFGSSTEKTRDVLEKSGKEPGVAPAAAGDAARKDSEKAGQAKPAKRKGHGRNGSAAYTGAKRIKVPHAELKHGDRCPDCGKGKVYDQERPAQLVRVVGMAPINADVYECERLRCNGCGKVFTADAPPGVGARKYDESVAAMVALFKYGCGVPFHRLEKFQAGLGIPLPAGTQWELIEESLEAVEPACEELIRQGAQGRLVHNDDTTMKILGYDVKARAEAMEEERKRTGTFTTGIISRAEGHDVALFFTGRNHAGENLAKVLKQREEGLSAPIQMCDALSRNAPGEFKTILANCLAHARRRFVDVVENFPEECRRVLETLCEVYKNDETARERGMPPEDRLRFHQERSGPLMRDLDEWLRIQIEECNVEPNSGVGEAIGYMRGHWEALTLFLRVPGAPLDNNICERALKKAILHRKNALFYKTENGARVGDIFMSLIHTAELNRENPFDYLVALQRNPDKVKSRPADWMPWNYRRALGANPSIPSPPP